MKQNLEPYEEQKLSGRRKSIPLLGPLLTSNKAWVRNPIGWALGVAFGAACVCLILVPAQLLPDYIALPMAFTVGMILWGFLIGPPKKRTRWFWTFSALLWGAGVCLVYADAFHQRHHVLSGWYWAGAGLQLLAAILLVIYYLTGRTRKRNNQ